MDWVVRLYLDVRDIPQGKGGVYLLFVGELLDYVGQSEDVSRRLASMHHIYEKETHTMIAFIGEEDYGTRLSLERYFNNKYNPPNSYIGTEKQAGDSSDWHKISAEERRKARKGLKFEEFSIDPLHAREKTVFEFSQLQITDNVMGVPSIIALRPEDTRKS